MKKIINLGSGVGTHDGEGARSAGQKINENFTEVYDAIDLLISDSSIYNKIITTTGFSLTGQNLTVNANWEWILSNVGKTNPANVVIDIPFCSTGKSRIEYIVPNDSNGFTRIIGAESATIPVAPQIPNEDMYVTWYTVDDGSVGVPSQPVIGDNFISKREKAAFQVYQSGEINNTVLDDFFYGYLNFRDAVTNLKSIGTNTNAHLYSGRELLIKNSQATDITIYHLTGSGFQFSFPNEVNFVLKPNEIIRFSTKILSPTSGILEYVGVVTTKADIGLSNVDNTSDVNKPVSTAQQAALDLKLNTADYNQHFKGVYLTEAALNAAHPTANVGDYAQVNEAGGTDVVNYSWDAEENIWVAVGGTGGAVNTDALPEGSTNLYFTVARFLANLTYANVISALGFTPSTAPNDAQKNSDITKAEIEAKLTGEITTHTHQKTDTISYAISDTSTALVAGDTDPFNAPYNFTLVNYWIGVKTAPTVSSLIVDLKKNGTSITSTKAGIDATEKTSLTGTSPVLTTTSFTKGDEITPNIYQVGSSETGRSLKLYLEIIKT